MYVLCRHHAFGIRRVPNIRLCIHQTAPPRTRYNCWGARSEPRRYLWHATDPMFRVTNERVTETEKWNFYIFYFDVIKLYTRRRIRDGVRAMKMIPNGERIVRVEKKEPDGGERWEDWRDLGFEDSLLFRCTIAEPFLFCCFKLLFLPRLENPTPHSTIPKSRTQT